MNNSKLQFKIACQCAVNKTIVAITSSLSKSNNVTENIASLNPFKFSSEYHDSAIGLVYYNYRHYNPNDGRWLSRDQIAEEGGYNLYNFIQNNVLNKIDLYGLKCDGSCVKRTMNTFSNINISLTGTCSSWFTKSNIIKEIKDGATKNLNKQVDYTTCKGKIDNRNCMCKNWKSTAFSDTETEDTTHSIYWKGWSLTPNVLDKYEPNCKTCNLKMTVKITWNGVKETGTCC